MEVATTWLRRRRQWRLREILELKHMEKWLSESEVKSYFF